MDSFLICQLNKITGQGDRGTHVNISGAGVAKNSSNLSAAIKFIEHLTEYQSQ